MSTILPVWNETYSPAEGERGKFVALDMSTISSYPSSGNGKYALLTYGVNASPITLTDVVSATFIGPITLTGIISTDAVYIEDVKLKQCNTSINVSDAYFTSAVSAISFNPPLRELEIFNNSNDNAYLMFYSPSSNFSVLSSIGLIIPSNSFYQIQRDVDNVYIGTDGFSSDLRIIGHYIT